MSSEASSSELDPDQMLKDLQSWWEIPSIAQYISLFRESFNLPEIEIEELEKGFIDDTCNGPSTWLQTLIMAFLRSIRYRFPINAENWEFQLRKLIKRKWSEDEENPFPEDKSFQELTLRAKVVIVYCLCLYRLDGHDIGEVMKSMDAEALRVQKLGVDSVGNTYWYFYGTRLYKEEVDIKKSWDEEWKKQKETLKKRGRGRPRKRVLKSDGESDSFEDYDFTKNNGYMNVSAKSRWSVVCDTIEEWVNFAEKFKNSKSKDELSLFKIIQENFLPTLSKIYEEKEKKLQQKIRELMPVREKIVTRRETRRLRGENVDFDYAALNGYDSSDESFQRTPVKDRATRLEERNKRASEANEVQYVQAARKRSRMNESESGSELDLPVHQKSSSSESKSEDLQFQMESLLSTIKIHKDAWPFLYPVSEEDAPGYYEIITDPIDLSKIERRLFAGEYETIGDLDADFSKMVTNCELYNGEFHDYSRMVQMLRTAFRKGVAKILDTLSSPENTPADSEGSNDSHYNSSSNSASPVAPSKIHKHLKEKKKKKKNYISDALNLLSQASDIAVQDDFVNSTSPRHKKSPVPRQSPAMVSVHQQTQSPESVHQQTGSPTSVHQQRQAMISVQQQTQSPESVHQQTGAPTSVHQQSQTPTSVHQGTQALASVHQHTSQALASVHQQIQVPATVHQQIQASSPVSKASPNVPSTNMPCSVPASLSNSVTVPNSTTSKRPLPVTSSNFVTGNTFTPAIQKVRPVIVTSKVSENVKQTPVENHATNSFSTASTNTNNNNAIPQNAIYQSNSKVYPVVFSYKSTSPATQSDLRFKNNPGTVTSIQPNMCMPNSVPVVQQVLFPAGSQQIQLQNNGQYVIASPQNTMRLLNKNQNVQILNNVSHVSQIPQFMAPTSVLQVSKDVMPTLQFQGVPQNAQAYSQVTQSPQFVNIPTYMLTNQNSISDPSSQPVMNLQPYQIPQRQMHIGGQGNV